MDGGAATVVLAAGAGRRLGGVAKATLRHRGGDTFLAVIAAQAAAAGAPVAVVVVADPHRADTELEARRLGLETVVNHDPSRGMASSVAVAFAGAHRWTCDAALLWPVDHAYVTDDAVRAVLAVAGADTIVVPTFGGRGGHPTAFGRTMWPALATCDHAPDGARSLLRDHAQQVVRIAVDDRGVVADVDTPDDRRRS